MADEGKPGALRENVEAIVVAVVLALLIRQYAVEAFVIPTGSLAPTLLGAHIDLECPNCGKPQPIGWSGLGGGRRLRESRASGQGNAVGKCPGCGKVHAPTLLDDAFIGRRAEVVCDACGETVPVIARPAPLGSGERLVAAVCPNCEIEFESRVDLSLWPRGDISRGDRILVDKFGYRFEPPGRFEITVFKFPDRPDQNYIKRLIGLPGETIDVRDGDIYADGVIARKPDRVQETVWQPVHESWYVEKEPEGPGRPAAWRAEGGRWRRVEGARSWRGEAPGAGTAWLTYGREIRDFNRYNEPGTTQGGRFRVADRRIAFRVAPAGAGTRALARLTSGPETIEARIDCDTGAASLRLNGQDLPARAGAAPAGAPGSRERTIDLARFDRQIVLRVDGHEVGRLLLDDSADPDTHETGLRLGLEGGAAVVRDLAVYRDVYYLQSVSGGPSSRFPYRVPEGSYFFLGDNSSNSTDGRSWGTVPEGHLAGRAFLVFWPALPWDFAVRRIR